MGAWGSPRLVYTGAVPRIQGRRDPHLSVSVYVVAAAAAALAMRVPAILGAVRLQMAPGVRLLCPPPPIASSRSSSDIHALPLPVHPRACRAGGVGARAFRAAEPCGGCGGRAGGVVRWAGSVPSRSHRRKSVHRRPRRVRWLRAWGLHMGLLGLGRVAAH